MTAKLEETIARLATVPHRIADPELIPAPRYYDPDFFALERERLWPKVWQMACRLEEIPEPGDYTVYEILDHSVILINTGEDVRAFRNACRHRGVRLVHGPGRVGEAGFVCPFHGWRFAPTGECTFVYGRPIFSERVLEPAAIGLAPVRVETWGGCAFINFDEEAPPLREWLGPVAERLEARHVDRLRAEWWCGTVLPTNWKLAVEAFQEGYHVMQTHPQLYERTYRAGAFYGPDAEGRMPNEQVTAREAVNLAVDFLARLSEGMAGMVHRTEVEVLERLRNLEVPEDPDLAYQMFMGTAWEEIARDARARGVPMFDIARVMREIEFHAVEFIFPHFFLLPMIGAMSSYRVRPLGPESCFFEIWSLVIPPEGEPFESPLEPRILPYDSPEFPEIPRQDYSNLPLQQRGVHDLEVLRLGRGGNGLPGEGMISNYQRLIDGFLAGLDWQHLTRASRIVNSGFDAPILDIGF